jgi:hypothetical protein
VKSRMDGGKGVSSSTSSRASGVRMYFAKGNCGVGVESVSTFPSGFLNPRFSVEVEELPRVSVEGTADFAGVDLSRSLRVLPSLSRVSGVPKISFLYELHAPVEGRPLAFVGCLGGVGFRGLLGSSGLRDPRKMLKAAEELVIRFMFNGFCYFNIFGAMMGSSCTVIVFDFELHTLKTGRRILVDHSHLSAIIYYVAFLNFCSLSNFKSFGFINVK